jgi:hypothetical protein
MLAGACGGGLQFAKDTRLEIVAPKSLAMVSAPVRVRWTSEIGMHRDLLYAVFVDHLPVHPGQSLRSMADASCASVRSCVDEAWLNRHFVYVTRDSSLQLDALPIKDPATGEPDMHQVTIVLVDGAWRRIGEAAWRVTFERGTPA